MTTHQVAMDGILEHGFRFAFAETTISSATDFSEDEQWDRRRKLVEGVRFTRRFVPTYHGVILVIVLLLSVIHWTEQFSGQRRRRWNTRRHSLSSKSDSVSNQDERSPCIHTFSEPNVSLDDSLDISLSSSGSSTIGSLSSPLPKEQADEVTPLLKRDQLQSPLGFPKTALYSFNAALMYQPSPIPVVGRVLPPNRQSLAIAFFIGLNLFYIVYRIPLEIQEWFVMSDRAGFLFAVNLPYLYILGAKTQPLKFLTGRSYESLNLFHRRLGEVLCLQALVHAVAMITAWYFIIRPNGYNLTWFLTQRLIVYGLITFSAYELLYFTSLASFRQRWYELFLGSHIILQVLALLFLYLHHPTGRPYVLASLAIYLIDRCIYRVLLKRTTLEGHATIMEDDETVKLSVEVTLKQPPRSTLNPFRKSITNGWKATDHIFVTIPSIGPRYMLQAHPFTIASRAPTPEEKQAQLTLLIRARDGFSAELLMRVRSHNKLAVQIDGPYGGDHARGILEHTDLAILVAGGSGIAVLWPLVHHLLDIAHCGDIETVPALQSRKQRIILIWVIHKGEHIEWIGRKALAAAENGGVEIIVPRATEEVGRPDLEGIINRTVSDSTTSRTIKKRIGVIASGPDSMGRLVRNTCASMVRAGLDINVAVEKFGW
jgi:hypothetical protein